MMKLKQILFYIVLTGLLSSCVPVPSYSTDSYVGSLKQCLDIQGTYESTNSYASPDNQLRLNMSLVDEALPRGLWEKMRGSSFKAGEPAKDKYIYVRSWITFRFLDDQRTAIGIFNELGQEASIVYDMKESNRTGVFDSENEVLICNALSWQRSYTRVMGGGGGGGRESQNKSAPSS